MEMKNKIGFLALLILLLIAIDVNAQAVSERVTWKQLDTLVQDSVSLAVPRDSLVVDTMKAEYQYVMIFVTTDTNSNVDTIVCEVLSPVYKKWVPISIRALYGVTNDEYIVPGVSATRAYMVYFPASWIYRLRLTNVNMVRRRVLLEQYSINR